MTDIPIPARVYLLEPHPVLLETLREGAPDLDIVKAGPRDDVIPQTDRPFAVIGFNPGERIAAFREAVWVHCAGAGVDKLERAMDFTPPLVTRTIGMLGHQMAEYVLTYFLARTQKLRFRDYLQRTRRWDHRAARADHAFTRRALIFGTGPMGATTALYLNALGVQTIGISRSGDEKEEFDMVTTLDCLDIVEPDTIDLVVLALPETDGTKGLVNADVLSQFRDVQLINIGRGPALPVPDLLAAIGAGHVGEAVLDVFDEEPLPATSPLWDNERVIITPHVAGGTRPQDTAQEFLECLEDLKAGQAPRHLWRG